MDHYNTIDILTSIATFKKEMANWCGERTILFDADNTLYMFSTYGSIDASLQRMYTKGFYKNLPIFQEAPDVIVALQKLGITVGICSALINSLYVQQERLESLHYYFPTIEDKDIYFVQSGTPKSTIIKDIKHTILVDDYHANLVDFYEHGGIGIKKSYSGKSRPVPVICNLIELFPILHNLNFFKRKET